MLFTSLSRAIQRQWLKQGLWSQLLSPLSKISHHYAQKKRFQFLTGKRDVYQAPVPVIVVGNIFVGGTGKTPLVIALTQALTSQGHQVGIVSRGYGVHVGKEARLSTEVSIDKKMATWIGDEPSLLAQYAPVAVHPERAKAVQKLLQHHPEVTVIISDDGLQHYALARDIEIVVQDTRRVGNGQMLPAGPLREPVDRLKSVDFIVTNYNQLSAVPTVIQDMLKARSSDAGESPIATDKTIGSSTEKSSSREAPTHRHPQAITMYLTVTTLEQLSTGKKLSPSEFLAQYGHQKLYAIAGIGNPQRFYQTLVECNIPYQSTQDFADHYAFKAADLQPYQDGIVLMTSKDASKCRHFAKDNCWSVEVSAQFYPADFFDKVQHLLAMPRPKKLNIPVSQSHCCSGNGCSGGSCGG